MAERVKLVAYDPRWPEAFECEAQAIGDASGGCLLELHHIGSTAIPGMIAKPVIDILGIATSLDAVEQHRAEMEAIGYEWRGEWGIPGRRYLKKLCSGRGYSAVQIHIHAAGSEKAAKHLLFRDYLRSHPDEASRYRLLKKKWAKEAGGDRVKYTEVKTPYIEGVLKRASEGVPPEDVVAAAKSAYDSVGRLYAEHVDDPESNNNLISRPCMLRLLEGVEGQRILDLCCGEGFYSRACARKGAHVTGVDLCQELVALARQRAEAESLSIDFVVGDAKEVLRSMKAGSFDGCVCGVGLAYIVDLEELFREVARVLAPGGWFLFSNTHPITDSGTWHRDERGRLGRVVVDYFANRVMQGPWPGMRKRFNVEFAPPYVMHRLEEYVEALHRSGFMTERLLEPFPIPEAKNAPYYERLSTVPRFLVVRAVKGEAEAAEGAGAKRNNQPAQETREPAQRLEGEIALQDVADAARTAYNSIGEFYAQHVDRPESYNNLVERPCVLDLLGDVRGQRVLDLCCGEGFYSRACAERGAAVTGIDLSERQIELARLRASAESLSIEFAVGNVGEGLPSLRANSFDGCVCGMGLDCVVDLDAVFGEVARVLVPGGWFIFSNIHPVMNFGVWQRCDDGRLGRIVLDYFVKRAVTVPWPTLRRKWRVEFAPPYVTHTLEDKAEGLYRAGFLVERLREPRPDPEAAERSRKDYEQLVTGPHFIAVRAIKRKSR